MKLIMNIIYAIFSKFYAIKSLPFIIIIGVSSVFCIAPMIYHQSLLVSHDVLTHLFQSKEFTNSIYSGTLMPKWASGANNGYGGANFIFYSPLSYYVVALFHYFIPSLVLSIIAAIWLSFYLSGISMFFMVRKFSCSKTALICALFYQLFPFHIFDLYLRGTLGELFAFAWFPLIFTFINEIFDSEKKHCAIISLSVSYAGLILTHLVSAFIVSIIIILYLSAYIPQVNSRKNLVLVFSSLLLGFGLSSYFLLPIPFELHFIKIDYIKMFPFANYKFNFLFQINSFHNELIPVNTLKFVSLLNFVFVLQLVLFIIFIRYFFKCKKSPASQRMAFFAIYMFSIAFFMATPLSKWLWDFLPILNIIQFPWRWACYTEIALIFMLPSLFNSPPSNRFIDFRKFKHSIYVLSALVILSVITIFVRNQIPDRQLFNQILSPEKYGFDTTLPREYTPVWANNLDKTLKETKPERVAVISGDAVTRLELWNPEKRTISVKALSPSLLRFATFYYPGWQAKIDGAPESIAIEKVSGAMLLKVLPGEHLITLEFNDTPLRKSSKIITLFSFIILGGYIAYLAFRPTSSTTVPPGKFNWSN